MGSFLQPPLLPSLLTSTDKTEYVILQEHGATAPPGMEKARKPANQYKNPDAGRTISGGSSSGIKASGGQDSKSAGVSARNSSTTVTSNGNNGRSGGEANPFEEEEWDEYPNEALVDNGEPGVPVKALYDYEGAEFDELSFKKGWFSFYLFISSSFFLD